MAVQPSNTMIYRYMDTNGDGTGTKNAIGNYSASATPFFYKASASGGGSYLYRMIITIEDTTGFTAQEYGNLGSALSNGWELQVLTSADDVLCDITDGISITTNAEISRQMYDVDVKTWGAGNELLSGRFTFARAGAPFYLEPGDKMQIIFNDDLSGLLEHYFQVQGIQRY